MTDFLKFHSWQSSLQRDNLLTIRPGFVVYSRYHLSLPQNKGSPIVDEHSVSFPKTHLDLLSITSSPFLLYGKKKLGGQPGHTVRLVIRCSILLSQTFRSFFQVINSTFFHPLVSLPQADFGPALYYPGVLSPSNFCFVRDSMSPTGS